MVDQPALGVSSVCQGVTVSDNAADTTLNGIFKVGNAPNQKDGLATLGLVFNSTSGRATNVNTVLDRARQGMTTYLMPRPSMGDNKTLRTDVVTLMKYDKELAENLNNEYCFYEARYKVALKQFLGLATSGDEGTNSQAEQKLSVVRALNLKLNILLEIMNFLANERIGNVNVSKEKINRNTSRLNSIKGEIENTANFLNQQNVLLATQKEAIRYTKEKNNFNTNRISLWVALNVLAVTTVFYVYRS